MNFIGDFFAIGIVLVIFLFYFDSKRHLTAASKLYIACLILTALTAATDLLTGKLLTIENVPLWINLGANSLYFLVNILTTTYIALFLFTKILEHSHNSHCMRNARCGLAILLSVYLVMILANIWTGWLFYFDADGAYYRGPLNAFGYFITICQMGLVLVCYFRNRKNASKSMRRLLVQTFPIVVLCILIQRTFPEIMLNGYFMAMFDAVLYMTFQGQQHSIHTLTKLNDRHSFFKEVEHRMMKKAPFQVFLINLKSFSSINHKYGHLFGDELLYHFAFSLETLIKDSIAFHMSGTVFSLVLPYTSAIHAENYREALLRFLEAGTDCMNERICFDYIMAEYLMDTPEDNAEIFYERLEYAASLAYQKNCRYIRYTPEIGAQMDRKRYLIERLQTVDEEHGFQVWYQPICCLKTGAFCSMEALIRLREPDGTVIAPQEFIPLAEKAGIITPITWFVLEQTCALLSRHSQLSSVTASVNLPMTQLLDKSFIPRLNSIVDHYGVDRRHICLEFTERELLDSFEQTKDVMEELTRSGYRFYLDDFGTGYSNFACISRLPFQFLKLDASLIRSSKENPQSRTLVQTLTKLSHDMGMDVIAEGVETQEDVTVLGQQGVDRIQGYVFTKPLPAEDLLTFYQNNPLH